MTRIPDERLDLHNLGPLSREDAEALLASLPRDPLHVAGDEPVELRRGPRDRRRRRTYGLPVLLFACLLTAILTLLVARNAFAASRGAHVIPAFIGVTTEEPDRGLPEALAGASPILEPLLTGSPAPRPAVEQPTTNPTTVSRGLVATSKPAVVLPPAGYAGWHRDPSVSWFGPGFYGQRTACGQTLTEGLQGVAHRTLPCGTLITFRNAAGIEVTVPVVDRGPYVAGRQWDLTGATCLALDHCWTGPLDWRLK